MPELAPPGPVLDIAKRLEKAGFETWCVGGAVRDALMGHPHLDWDLATAATPQEVRRLFRRTVPVGMEFGTVGVLDERGTMHEVTTFRRDVETDGRHAVVTFGATIDEDLARRDFTLNAIAYHPASRRLHDPFKGQEDIARRLVRAVGHAPERLREDRLRALRAIRFASRFGFEIEASTWHAIQESAPHLTRLSAERIKQELEKTMDQVARPSVAIRRWYSSGALRVLIPALGDIDEIALATLDCLPMPGGKRASERRMLRLAALFFDVETRLLERALRALKFSNQQIGWMTALSQHGGTLLTLLREGGDLEDTTLRRWIADSGRMRAPATVRLVAARVSAARRANRPVPAGDVMRALYRRVVTAAFRDPVELSDLAIGGDDLRRAGVPEGPAMGWMLHRLLDAVLEDPRRNTVDELQRLAPDLLRRYQQGER